MASVTTVPTGSSSGSAAAMPRRTFTPAAVVCPLQYAVASKARCEPGAGRSSSSPSMSSQAPYPESSMRVSYTEHGHDERGDESDEGSTRRRDERERHGLHVGAAFSARPVSRKVFEPVGQRAAARGVAHEEVGPPRDDADPGYRQIADAATGAPQPAAVARPDREEQLVVVAAAERGRQPVGAGRRVPGARLVRNGQRPGVDLHADTRRARQLAQSVRQTIAEVHAARRSSMMRQLEPGAHPGFGAQVSRGRRPTRP